MFARWALARTGGKGGPLSAVHPDACPGFWFQKWCERLDAVIALKQTIVVITKNRADWKACAVEPRAREDWEWDWEGVGNSQKGEIKYARLALRRAHPGRSEVRPARNPLALRHDLAWRVLSRLIAPTPTRPRRPRSMP